MKPDPVADALRIAHVGSIDHDGPGRTDDTRMHVKADSFVIPADVVSSLGQGNTAAGQRALEIMFPTHGIARKSGGNVPIVAAGGEFIVPPERVARLGGGDIDKGHKILDHMVRHARRDTIKTLKKLPGPEKG